LLAARIEALAWFAAGRGEQSARVRREGSRVAVAEKSVARTRKAGSGGFLPTNLHPVKAPVCEKIGVAGIDCKTALSFDGLQQVQ